jgi:hypothetical protein
LGAVSQADKHHLRAGAKSEARARTAQTICARVLRICLKAIWASATTSACPRSSGSASALQMPAATRSTSAATAGSRTTTAASPCRRALRRTRSFPAVVRGPVLRRALRRLAAILASEVTRSHIAAVVMQPDEVGRVRLGSSRRTLRKRGARCSRRRSISRRVSLRRSDAIIFSTPLYWSIRWMNSPAESFSLWGRALVCTGRPPSHKPWQPFHEL